MAHVTLSLTRATSCSDTWTKKGTSLTVTVKRKMRNMFTEWPAAEAKGRSPEEPGSTTS